MAVSLTHWSLEPFCWKKGRNNNRHRAPCVQRNCQANVRELQFHLTLHIRKLRSYIKEKSLLKSFPMRKLKENMEKSVPGAFSVKGNNAVRQDFFFQSHLYCAVPNCTVPNCTVLMILDIPMSLTQSPESKYFQFIFTQ